MPRILIVDDDRSIPPDAREVPRRGGLAKSDVLDEPLRPLGAVVPAGEPAPDAALPTLREIERRHVVHVLAHTEWNKRVRARCSTSATRRSIARSRSMACAARTVIGGLAALVIAAIGAAYAGLVIRAAPAQRDNLAFGALALTGAAMTAWRGINVRSGQPIVSSSVLAPAPATILLAVLTLEFAAAIAHDIRTPTPRPGSPPRTRPLPRRVIGHSPTVRAPSGSPRPRPRRRRPGPSSTRRTSRSIRRCCARRATA